MDFNGNNNAAFMAQEERRVATTNWATITLKSLGQGPLPLPLELRYTVENTPIRRSIQGISIGILELYAPNIGNLVDTSGTVIIPSSFYTATSEAWPLAPPLRDGRPFAAILDWICRAFTSRGREVSMQIPFQASDLCVSLLACRILGLEAESRQLETHILDIVTYRRLTFPEIKAIWRYATLRSLPLPALNSSFSSSETDIRLPGFCSPSLLRMYAHNVRCVTLPFWSSPSYQLGSFEDEYVQFMEWSRNEPSLRALVFAPTLGTWVELIERVVDKEENRRRFEEWVESNGVNLGGD